MSNPNVNSIYSDSVENRGRLTPFKVGTPPQLQDQALGGLDKHKGGWGSFQLVDVKSHI